MRATSFTDDTGVSRLNLFLALSRTPHLLLDLAAPGLAALLYLGSFPPAGVLILGIITAYAGYTAVYALNDLVDYRVDREIVPHAASPESGHDLDGIFVRHPLAQGLLSYPKALFWTAGWASVALIGAYTLNPVCVAIFCAASLMEIIYCKLLKITHLRSLISGIVKTSGPLAAVFAVDPSPSPLYLTTLLLWLFSWEIGGQNVPNDLSDLDTDQSIHARTIPVRIGIHGSTLIILASLGTAVAMSLAMHWAAPWRPGLLYLIGALSAGSFFLLLPGMHLYRTGDRDGAFRLFNRASYYPLTMLAVTILAMAI